MEIYLVSLLPPSVQKSAIGIHNLRHVSRRNVSQIERFLSPHLLNHLHLKHLNHIHMKGFVSQTVALYITQCFVYQYFFFFLVINFCSKYQRYM